jgi:RNase P subunit RPR2
VAHYMTTEEEWVRQLLSIRCKRCSRIFLYEREVDRVVDIAGDRAYVTCPCGHEQTLAIGGTVAPKAGA